MTETPDPVTFAARIERSLQYRAKHYLGLVRRENEKIKKNARTLRWEFESWADSKLLRRRFPELRNYNDLAREKRERLLPYYADYISRVSTEDSAISLELSVFLLVMCDILKPRNILDLGSGFSSFVFRSYMISADPRPTVCSVDDTEMWLEKTRSFLEHHGFPSDNLFNWRDFSEGNKKKFDFILHDLGDSPDSMIIRKSTLKPILALSQPGGIVILDDVHMKAYRPYAMRVLNEHRLKHFSLRSFTLDKFGRFSQLICN
jgi:predicted O-methyltransferase YrrM